MNFLKAALKANLLKLTLLSGTVLLTFYFFYRVTFINFSPALAVFSFILFLAELHTIFHLYGMFYSLWPRKYKRYPLLNSNRKLKMNIFICACGEPTEIIRDTIAAAVKAKNYYISTVGPQVMPEIIVLNDGKHAKKDNWQEIEQLAHEYGVTHIAREIGGGYKAGNINNGLAMTPTNDPFNTLDIVLDADFAVKEHFLTEIAKPFRDKEVDFAQSPQRYKNEKTWVAKASAAHQIFFFEHICDSKGHDNALFLCGTNFAVRRSALNEIGGMNTKFITEDYATSLEMHLRGMKGVFIPEVIAEGVAPSSLKQYFNQQQRWAKGSFDVSFHYLKQILFGPLTIRQKFHYMLSATYYLIGVRDLILMLAPLPYLLFGVSLIKANTLEYLFFIYLPLFIYNFVLYAVLFRHPIKSLVLDIASFPVFVAAFFSSVLKKNLSFIVTIKSYEKENPFTVYKLQLLVAGLLAFALYYGIKNPVSNNAGVFLNFFWATFDVVVLAIGFYLIVRENYNTQLFEKITLAIPRALAYVGNATFGYSRMTRGVGIVLLTMILGYSAMQVPAVNTLASSLPAELNIAPSKELLVPSQGVYYGYYQPSLNTHPENPITEVVAGEKTSLVMFYQDWGSKSGFNSTLMSKLSSDGRTPIITWEPWDASSGSIDIETHAQYSPQSIIDGEHDEYIRNWARGAAAYNQPFFLRFAHEMNGNWYPWGNSKNDPATYKKMWKHVHDIFEEEGATNVVWVWSPNNTDEFGSSDTILAYYPGDAYVDWVGVSGFNWGTTGTATKWSEFEQIIAAAYAQLKTLNKPIMVAETSSVSAGGDKTAWYKAAIAILPEYAQIKAIVFFNQDIKNADFSLNSGQNYNETAKTAVINNEYMLKNAILK